jgi:nucleoside-diphosphate-sugar epimerase
MLGWSAQTSLEKGIAQTAAWFAQAYRTDVTASP